MSNDDQAPTAEDDTPSTGIARRSLLYGTGLVGLLGYGATAAAADPQGQVGTESDPLRALYTETLDGGVTGGQPLDDLVGTGLEIDGGTLTAPDSAPDGVRWVGESGAAYTSVQAAIDDATDGDLVRIGPGTYEESVSWPSGTTVHVAGSGRTATTITADTTGATVDVAGDSELRGVTVRNESTDDGAAAIAHDDQGDVVVRDVDTDSDGEACVRSDSGSLEIQDATMAGASAGILLNDGQVTARECRLLTDEQAVIVFDGTCELYRSQVTGPIDGFVQGGRNYGANYQDRSV